MSPSCLRPRRLPLLLLALLGPGCQGAPSTTELPETDGAFASVDAGSRTDGNDPSASGSSDGASARTPHVTVSAVTGALTGEPMLVAEGVALANRTMATECFKRFVLDAKWTETNGLSQAEIWDLLCRVPITVEVDLFTGTWYQNHVTRTVGYEDEPGVVHMNRYFVDTAYGVANNLIHEAEGHSQGFSHYGVKATSVPYGLNDAFEACSPVAP